MFELTDKQVCYSFEDGSKFSFTPDHVAMIHKFDDVFGIINTFLHNHESFKDIYEPFIREYMNTQNKETRFEIFKRYYKPINDIIRFIYDIEELANLVPKQEMRKNAKYHVDNEEAIELMKTSLVFRVFLFVLASDQAVSEGNRTRAQNIIFENLNALGTLQKLFSIVSSIIYVSVQQSHKNNSKKSIWVILSNTFGYSPIGYSVEIFNNIVYRALPSLRLNTNPVIYFIAMAREKLKFLLTKQYKYTLNEAPFEPEILQHKSTVEDQIIYKAIVQNLVVDILTKYNYLKNVLKCNGYIVFKNIANPIVTKILDLPLSKLVLSNPQVLNFLAYDIIINSGVTYRYIPRLLTACSKLRLVTDLDSTSNKKLNKLVRDITAKYNIAPKLYLKKPALNHLFMHSINLLLSQSYFVNRSNIPLSIQLDEFVDEYIRYMNDVLTGKFNDQISLWREKIAYGSELNVSN